ncbi:DNA mismatch repair endonuclease MutL [Haloferula rosea]|uniref:DNA mismatch repair protein MutL n=1 Tax=Haloferula rosea TaxID=490093 RepID=A0A934R9H9_9BACT|nr:DNA mismatch repair endonuclease MutL [Haloferula rosea]MBK1827669.1 DNA mismatch repair endonuclease MutL [Haloferula rosea]
MPRIQVLPDILASQVAAGEVVERPASVVKELVENSIDAGAGEVLVEIRRGGAALIRVGDDGSGMSREDALLSLERHATSKLRDAGGLHQIRTLGFRGEAVPSIASVSRFRMTTRQADEVAGHEVQVEGGTIGEIREAGCAPGTVIEVRDLFFNVPARRKFLRTETTESAHIEHQLRLHALAAAGVRLRFRKDEREVFDLPAGMSRRDRVRWMLGTETGSELLTLPVVEGKGAQVEGFVLPASHARKGRRHQCVFLNGRPVEDSAVSRGLVEGFRGGLVDGVHPAAWLWIEMDPALVDVNVHPAKREIRLHRPHELRELISRAVQEGLQQAKENSVATDLPRPQAASAAPPVFSASKPAPVPPQDRLHAEPAGKTSPVDPFPRREWVAPVIDQPLPLKSEDKEEVSSAEKFRLIGELHGRYALLESEDGLVLLDPRAARERILYERWLAIGGVVESQALLVPLILEPGPREVETMLRHQAVFAEAGFELESFGGGALSVAAIPEFLDPGEIRALLLDVADELVEGAAARSRFALDRLAKSLARQAALLESPRPGEAMALLKQLFRCDLPYCGADGRPTMTEFSIRELEKRLGGA